MLQCETEERFALSSVSICGATVGVPGGRTGLIVGWTCCDELVELALGLGVETLDAYVVAAKAGCPLTGENANPELPEAFCRELLRVPGLYGFCICWLMVLCRRGSAGAASCLNP